MATIDEIKKVRGPRAKHPPALPMKMMYKLCVPTLPDGVDYATWRKVTDALAAEMCDTILNGGLVELPKRMGSISLRRKPRVVRIGEDGKPRVNTPVDWGATVRLWAADDSAREKRTLIRHESKNVYAILYTKDGFAHLYNNKVSFKPSRTLKLRLKDKLKDGELDCMVMTRVTEIKREDD